MHVRELSSEPLRQAQVHSERRASEREQHGHGVEERAPGSVERGRLPAKLRITAQGQLASSCDAAEGKDVAPRRG